MIHGKRLAGTLFLIPTLHLLLSTHSFAEVPTGKAGKVAVEHIRDGMAQPGPVDETQSRLPRYSPGKLVVKLKDGMTVAALATAKEKHNLKIKEKNLSNNTHHRFKNIYEVRAAIDADLPALAAELGADPAVDYAEPVAVSFTQFTPTDPLYPQQWSHKNTSAAAGWDITTGSSSVIVAVVDTGVAYNHPDLAANIWRDPQGNPGRDFVDIDTSAWISAGYQLITGEDYTTADSDPGDYNGHGTHVAGIIGAAGNNGFGVVGVCPSCRIMPVRAGFSIRLGSTDYGSLESDDIANAIIYAADNGAKVINMSFGGSYSQLQADALNYADSKGVVLIAAAGNSNTSTTNNAYPGYAGNVLAVAATGHLDERAYYSNYGSWVDVAAPGGDAGSYPILSTVPTVGSLSDPSGYKGLSGTSMASPYVAGLAGLILSKNPNLTNHQVMEIIKQGVDVYNADLPDSALYIGTGRVNVYKALTSNSSPTASASISSPAEDFIAGSSITISGSTSAPYRVLYGTGTYPSNWIEIASGVATSGALATLNPSIAATPFEGCTIKVVAQDQNGKTETVIHGTVGKNFLPGWPQLYSSLNKNISLWNAPNLGDLDNDGLNEIIIPGNDSSNRAFISAFKPDGTQAPGWPVTVPASSTYIDYGATVGDIDGDGNLEVVFPVFNSLNPSLNVYDRWGKLRWSKNLEDKDHPALNVTLADINGDGKAEIITQTLNSKLYALDYRGNVLWSYLLGEYDSWYNSKTVAVTDLDGDGKPEIIKNVIRNIRYGSGDTYRTLGGSLMAFNNDGTVRWRYDWPEPGEDITSTKYYNLNPIGSPIVADINGDGAPEIVVKLGAWKGNDTGTTESNTRFYAFDYTGKLVPGWPVKTAGYPGWSELAVADLERNGRRVVIAPSMNSVLAIRDNGTLLFPAATVNPQGNMAVADVTGDGKPDIIAYDGTHFKVIQADGTVSTLDITARNTGSNINNTPVLTDLNKSGSEKLVFFESGLRPVLWAWDLGIPHAAAAEQWTQYAGNAGHTGLIGSPSLSPVSIATSALPDGMAGAPYSLTLAATGGTPPYSWSVTRGSLIAGLTLGSASGLLSGTASFPGTSSFTVRAVDATGALAVRNLLLNTGGTFPPAKVSGSSTNYYSQLQDAYNFCADGDVIQLQGVLFGESPRFDRDITVSLKGGYDSAFSASVGSSTINGCIAVRFGKVKMYNLRVR